MTQDRRDVYTRITAEIIAAIEAGAGEFKMPWHHTGTSTARPPTSLPARAIAASTSSLSGSPPKSPATTAGFGAPIASGRRSKPRSARASAARPSCCGKRDPGRRRRPARRRGRSGPPHFRPGIHGLQCRPGRRLPARAGRAAAGDRTRRPCRGVHRQPRHHHRLRQPERLLPARNRHGAHARFRVFPRSRRLLRQLDPRVRPRLGREASARSRPQRAVRLRRLCARRDLGRDSSAA